MLDRKEVEALLDETRPYSGRKAAIVAELCRVWLAVQDAPVWWVDYKSASTCTLSSENSGGQRVRLVRDGDSGEGESC